MNRRTWAAAALAGGSLPAVLPGQASAALSTDDAIPPVADRVYELGHDRGFTSQRTDYQRRAITVRWSGAVPQDVQRYADSKRNGVTVTIVPGAKYSRAQAEAARTKLQTSAYGRQLGIVSTSLRQDGSGGPMFKKLSNGVQARGILLGPDTDYGQTTSCGTTDPDVGQIYCSRYLNYVPISTILNAWGVSLEVG